MFEIKKEPRLDWIDILGAGVIYLGFLLFIISLHLMAIRADGNTAQVLSTTFSVFLMVYVGLVVFGLVGIVVQLLRWLVWNTKTTNWEKRKQRGGT